MGKKISYFVSAIIGLHIFSSGALAQTSNAGFSIQVTPSPIVESIEPGVTKTVELKIRNQNSKPETLKMGLRAFSVKENGDIDLKNDEPQDVKDWVSFANPVFEIAAGEWFTQKITFAVPKEAGFTYSFAVTISRSAPPQKETGTTAIEGSVAVFTLLSTNRADATRKLDLVTFSSKKKVYDYLPAIFSVTLKNGGNTLLKPTGTVYIQRTSKSDNPIATMTFNASGAYILPDVTRTISLDWASGFPVHKTDSTTNKTKLLWNWSDLQHFRFGKYVAKAVVVYNDGQRDIPVEAEISFWVIPWKMLTVLFLLIALVVTGVVTIVKKAIRVARKGKHSNNAHSAS